MGLPLEISDERSSQAFWHGPNSVGQKAGDLGAAGWGCENERTGYLKWQVKFISS